MRIYIGDYNMNDEERIREIFKRLNEIYTIRTFHDHDPYKVLIRTILSQRTRDENTDQAANALFDVYPDIYAVADAPVDHVQELIKPAGFYRVKAARILEVSRILIDQYGGEVHRISNRWGIADTKEPEETEIVLMEKVPKELWVDLNDLMVQFGQTICRPIGPQCDKCPLTDLCEYDVSKLE